MSPIAPGILIAMPLLADPNFERSVVLMLEHSEAGAMGLVVNRTASITLADVARGHDVEPSEAHASTPVFVGGPVEPERGFVIHDREDVAESVLLHDGLHLSGSVDSLKQLLDGAPEHFRLCLGYAGWGPGQLEKELQEGSWLASEISAHHVLHTAPGEMWTGVLRAMGIEPAMLMQGRGLH